MYVINASRLFSMVWKAVPTEFRLFDLKKSKPACECHWYPGLTRPHAHAAQASDRSGAPSLLDGVLTRGPDGEDIGLSWGGRV